VVSLLSRAGANYKLNLSGRTKMNFKNILKSSGALSVGIVLAIGAASSAVADYPTKPIKLYVGFSAGGGTDTTARGFASYVHEIAGMNEMPMVVVNRPGGSGMQAAKIAAKSKPDGYTLTIINSGTFAAADMASKNAPVKPRKDFTSIGCMSQLVTAILIQKKSPYKTAAAWVKAVKASGKTVRWSTSGAATMHASIGHLFLDTLNIKHQVIPFKGGSKARNALVAGKVDIAFLGAHLVKGFENEIMATGVPTNKRDPANKNVPTFGEQNLPKLNVTGPMCLWGPKGMPADTVAKLRAAVKGVAAIKGFKKFMKKAGLATFHVTADESVKKLNALYATLGPVIKKIKGFN
jgi:tripartite-type tricarboxylate transporter receptor subunit TctC